MAKSAKKVPYVRVRLSEGYRRSSVLPWRKTTHEKTNFRAFDVRLLLAGCGQTEPLKESYFPTVETVQALLVSGTSSEELEKLDPLLLFTLSGDAAALCVA